MIIWQLDDLLLWLTIMYNCIFYTYLYLITYIIMYTNKVVDVHIAIDEQQIYYSIKN